MSKNRKAGIIAILYFLLSAILSSIFIAGKFWLYSSTNAMILSATIASAKWLVQVVIAYLLLNKEIKWIFVKRISIVCFTGSLLLFVYYALGVLPIYISGFSQFVISIAISVSAMILMYYKVVRQSDLNLKWFWGWILCLCIAIALQVTVVF